jgi:sigma-54 dependent transcriptional regulator, acetoin dehydrogenase operon transcriptional activator AcoR
MADRKRRILFLGDGGNNLHLMANAFAHNMKTDSVDFISASMTPPKLNPTTQKVMLESGIDLSGLPLLSLLDVEPFMFDLIITLGEFDQDCRPTLPGMPPHIHWDLPDPSPGENENHRYNELKIAEAKIKSRLSTLFDSGFLNALFVTRRNLEGVLDNLLDGVMAHTRSRRIFFFNKAAEKITGYKRRDILGKDCHEVFPGRFCGGDCEFCETLTTKREKSILQKEIIFTRPDNIKRVLKMSIMPLIDENEQEVGALLSFKDDTELDLLKRRLKHHHSLGELVGKDPKTLEIFDQIREVSAVMAPVLIEGESGTGKELVANAIHNIGPRSKKPFVAINCGALPEGILESELFGHVIGAFSGAVQDRKGRFELAHEGTIFLDEVSELSPAMQVKLLRVLQEQKFERVGGEKSIQVNVRIISATNQNLIKLVEKKKFRRDLFYRLCVVPITLPPLRERRLDIPMLVEHFLEIISDEVKRPALTPSNEVMDLFSSYSWPGNVRELHNAIEYAYVKCRTGIITEKDLPPEIINRSDGKKIRPGPVLKHSKEDVIIALAKAEGNRKETARILGIGRATLYRYLDVFGLK